MKRELVISAGGTEVTVVVAGDPVRGPLQLTVDGVAQDVDARRVRPGTWSILVGGRSYEVDLDPRRGHLAASAGSGDLDLVVEDARERRLRQAAQRQGGSSRGETVRAPIAGKLVKVLVEVGATVAAGRPVVVLEAMKMENELCAERGGVVRSVLKTAGQTVDTGEPLVELAPAEA
ncbi:MAG: hypothetical protein KBG28_12125 [Kofleriaceae bacterium]|nr:hypothetical protein [Kofleriaceae bacterium]MBP6840877.1 hypothetical protein [Kofleriaceae bacterium]MBP9204706.1 hypothetical protein [Kofleriaceae bacterium]